MLIFVYIETHAALNVAIILMAFEGIALVNGLEQKCDMFRNDLLCMTLFIVQSLAIRESYSMWRIEMVIKL